MKYVKFPFHGLFLLSFLFFVACSGGGDKSKSDAESIDDISLDLSESGSSAYPVVELSKVINTLNEAGAGYVFSITNDPYNVDSYLSFKKQALNLGIYGADLSYAAIYGKQQQVDNYMEAFSTLFTKLEIGGDQAKGFADKLKANQENQDSLVNIISRGFIDTYRFLMENDQDELSLLILAGSWVEGVYLVGATIDFAEKKHPLRNLILEHKKSLNDLLKILEKYKDNPQLSEIYSTLTDLHNIFIAMEDKPEDEKIKALRNKIYEIRDAMI
jgi:hypothetical protein